MKLVSYMESEFVAY